LHLQGQRQDCLPSHQEFPARADPRVSDSGFPAHSETDRGTGGVGETISSIMVPEQGGKKTSRPSPRSNKTPSYWASYNGRRSSAGNSMSSGARSLTEPPRPRMSEWLHLSPPPTDEKSNSIRDADSSSCTGAIDTSEEPRCPLFLRLPARVCSAARASASSPTEPPTADDR